MISPILTSGSELKILGLFAETPGKALNRTELQKYTHLANNPLNGALNTLINFNVIERDNNNYRLNFKNDFVPKLMSLLMDEIKSLRNIPYGIWLILFDFNKKAIDKFKVDSLYLFGSWAKGIADVNSDIDIAMIIHKKSKEIEIEVSGLAESLKEKYDRDIQIHIFDEIEFKRKETVLIKEILKDGIKVV